MGPLRLSNGEAVTRAALAAAPGSPARPSPSAWTRCWPSEPGLRGRRRASTGGRRPGSWRSTSRAGHLAADLGATHSRAGGERPLRRAARRGASTSTSPTAPGSSGRRASASRAAGETARDDGEVRGMASASPARGLHRGRPVEPADHARLGRLLDPRWFARIYEAPVLVDNDVNIMALGEHGSHWRDVDHLLYIKVGTGIGCGHHRGPPCPSRRARGGRRHRPRARRRPRATSSAAAATWAASRRSPAAARSPQELPPRRSPRPDEPRRRAARPRPASRGDAGARGRPLPRRGARRLPSTSSTRA